MKTKTLINPTRRRDFFAFFALLLLTFTVLPAKAQMMYKTNNSFYGQYYNEENSSFFVKSAQNHTREFVRMTAAPGDNDYSGEYIFARNTYSGLGVWKTKDGSHSSYFGNGAYTETSITVSDNVITSNIDNCAIIKIEKQGSEYTLYNTSTNKYIDITANGLEEVDNPQTPYWSLSYVSNNRFKISKSFNSTTYYLKNTYNENPYEFTLNTNSTSSDTYGYCPNLYRRTDKFYVRGGTVQGSSESELGKYVISYTLGTVPIFVRSEKEYNQIIYPKDSLVAGIIKSIAFYSVSTYNGSGKRHLEIYIKETDKDNFYGTSFISVLNNELVFNGDVNFPTSEGWQNIEFTKPFEYTGDNNIVVAIYNTDVSGSYSSTLNTVRYKAFVYDKDGKQPHRYLNNLSTSPASTSVTGGTASPCRPYAYFVIVPDLETPVISLVSGTYHSNQTTTISSTTGDATIYYTIDNTDPATSSTRIEYTAPVTIDHGMTLRAVAVKGSSTSTEASATYTFQPMPPVITNAGVYGEPVDAVITPGDNNNVAIYYTTDGTTPTTSSTLYSSPFLISSKTTVKAIAVPSQTGWENSEVASGTYNILQPNGMTPAQNPAGLVMNKTFTPSPGSNSNNSGTITLESFVKGTSITVEDVIAPTDIVLVLDVSGSMTKAITGASSRFVALDNAVKNFLDLMKSSSVQPDGEVFPGEHHRVSFVTYGDYARLWHYYNQTPSSPGSYIYNTLSDITGNSNYFTNSFYEVDGTDTPKNAWHNIYMAYPNGEGTTELQYTMPVIKRLFDLNSPAIVNGQNEEIGTRNRLVVVFTDGGIGGGTWGGVNGDIYDASGTYYAEGKANYTLQQSYILKNDYKATMYSVGLFPTSSGSNYYPTVSFPSYNYVYNNGVQIAPTTQNHGVGWEEETTPEWAQNASRFMALRSSNYPFSTNMTTPGNGSNDRGYYIVANNASALANAFEKISQTVAKPSLSLGTQTVVEDVISDAFMLPEYAGTGDIQVYTAQCDIFSVSGNDTTYSFANPVVFSDAQVSINGKRVCVTNFDFAENWVGVSGNNARGKKLIITIPVERDMSGSEDGGIVKTNGDQSGIYGEDSEQVGAFLSPEVYLSVPDGCFDFEDVTGTAYNVSGNLPAEWHGCLYVDNPSSYVVAPHVVSGDTYNYPYDGTRSLLLASGYYTNGVSYVTMPAMYFTYLFDKQISFYYKTPGTGNGECILEVGYVTSIPADNASDWASAFHSLQTLPASSESEAGSVFTVSLSGVPTYGDVYVTFKWCGKPSGPVLGADRYCYIDGVCVKDPVRLWTEAVTSINDVPTGGFVVDSETGDITINCEEGLAWLISYVNGLNGSAAHPLEDTTVVITKPMIDMSEYIWVPIGYNTAHPFKGTFDACDNLISGVHMDARRQEIIYVEDKYGPMVYAGMFGYTDGATVKNMSLLLSGTAAHYAKDHISSRCENGYLGALVGYGKDLNMELCYVFNGVVAYGNLESVGGLVGHAEGNGAIKACMSGAHLGAGLSNGSSHQLDIKNAGGIVGSTGEGYAVKDGFSAFVDLQLKYYGSSLTAAGVENLGAVVGKGYATSNVYVHPFSLSLSTTVDGGTAPTNSYWYALEDENFDNVTEFTEAVPRTYDSYSVNNTINGRPLVDVLNDHVTPGFKWMTPPSPDVNLGYPVIVKEDDEAYAYFSLAVNNEHFMYLMRSDVNKIGTIATQLLSSKSSGEKADDDDDDDDESSMGIYMYSNGNISLGIPALINMHIDENVAVTQSTAEDVNTSVGITIKNPNGSGAEHRDWHTFATPLKQAPLGIKYCEADQSHTGYAPGSDNFLVFGPEGITTYDYAIDENGYFPAGIADRTQFDFYSYYEPEYHWINLKRKANNHWHEDEVEGLHPQINYDGESGQTYLEQGKGYLVGLGTTTENNNYMQARGVLTNGVVKHAVTAAGGNLKGYNLLGNPYQSYLDFHEFANVNEDVLWGEGNTTDTGYMAYLIFDAERNRFEQYLVDDDYIGFSDGAATTTSRYLNMHQGFFVVKRTEDPSASNVSDSVVFNNDMRVITPNSATYRSDVQPAYPLVNLFCTDADGNQEIVIMELERPLKAGSTKMKGMLNGKCNMYAHWGNDDLGAVFIDYMPDYVPVWFEAAEDGVFTITWSTANENFGYMHLIDNIAGVDYDCLAPGNDHYTFTSSVNDMSARFRVVFKPLGIEENESESNSNFAFFNGNELIVNGEGDIRLTDLNGRCVYSQHLAGQQNSVSLPVVADGMYLLQLKGTEGVKVQKIVIRK